MNGAAPQTDDGRCAEVPVAPAFIDGHVHIYPHVSLAAVFHAIKHNVRREGFEQCVLLLAEPRGVEGFTRLLRLGEKGGECPGLPAWKMLTKEDDQIDVRHEGGFRAVFLRGQQLVTEEGLEVLAAGMRGSVSHGLGLRSTIDEIRSRGGWATIAWGVGKWLGRRGRLVADAVREEAGSRDVMLGDNGGRPWCWVSVPQFALALEHGMPVVPGSDPLPISGDEIRIASYGTMLDLPAEEQGSIDAAVRRSLANRSGLEPRGRRVGAARSLYNQVRMQAVGRSAKRPGVPSDARS